MHFNFSDENKKSAPSEDIWRVDYEPPTSAKTAELGPISIPAQFGVGARIRAVTGAVGGSGVPVLASAFAQITDAPTLLVDLQFSGGIDTTLGIEKASGLRWSVVLKNLVKSHILREKCPQWNEISVLSNDPGEYELRLHQGNCDHYCMF
jgi:hypothetical protein